MQLTWINEVENKPKPTHPEHRCSHKGHGQVVWRHRRFRISRAWTENDAQHQSYADVGIGDRVTVSGYQGAGFVRFIGVINTQRTDGKVRLGVELDLPNGKHDGTVGGHAYFSCAAKHGLLVPRERVGLLAHNNVLSDGYVGVDGASGHIGHSNAPTDADGFGFNPVDPARIDDENSLSDSDV